MGAAPLLLGSPAMVGDPSLIGPFASGETRAVSFALGRIGPAIAHRRVAQPWPALPTAMPAWLVPTLRPWPGSCNASGPETNDGSDWGARRAAICPFSKGAGASKLRANRNQRKGGDPMSSGILHAAVPTKLDHARVGAASCEA